MKKRIPALVLAGIMAAACFTGCNNNKNNSTVVIDSPVATQAPVVTLPPGEEFNVDKGADFNYEKINLDIKLTEVALTSAKPDSKGGYSYAFVFTAKNNSSEAREISMLDEFTVNVDGTGYGNSMFTALSAANGALAYKGYDRYDAELEAGQEITGFVPFSIDTVDWKQMTIKYKPDSKNSNDYIIYTIDRSEVVDRYKGAENKEPVEETADENTEESAETEEVAEAEENAEENAEAAE